MKKEIEQEPVVTQRELERFRQNLLTGLEVGIHSYCDVLRDELDEDTEPEDIAENIFSYGEGLIKKHWRNTG